MSFTAAKLLAVLQAHVPGGATGFMIALSGGPDSGGLLAALCALRGERGMLPLRAVHIDHGLQPAAASFRAACESLCRSLEVPLTSIEAQVAAPAGVSIEAAARDARYAALGGELGAGECLLTAHHGEDQAETFLLQALRGAGLKGLASMPVCVRFAAGWHLRPLLGVRRADLRGFSAALALGVVLDPMNADARYDRVYLRRRLWPLIEARWPGAAAALARSASHTAEAQALLDAIADADLSLLRDGAALSVAHLRRLGSARRINALRRWIFDANVLPPPAARLHEALRQILDADADHLPAVLWDTHALRRYRNRLFLTAAVPPRFALARDWNPRQQPQLELDAGLGSLRCVLRPGGLDPRRLPEQLRVCGRAGGEALKPAASAATRSVQHLCQDLGVLPWLRDALPFVHAGGELIAIGDLWLDARWCAHPAEPGLAFDWVDAPNLV
jgi:tRNA(Ile)-lysidine synthase